VKILHGPAIDTLMVSRRVVLREGLNSDLEKLKLQAQETGSARFDLGGENSEVRRKGRGPYAFTLVNESRGIEIQIKKVEGWLSSHQRYSVGVPELYVIFRSRACPNLSENLEYVERVVLELARSHADIESEILSRVDVCVDFVPETDFASLGLRGWSCRMKGGKYESKEYGTPSRFSGYWFRSGDMVTRLYDKPYELNVTKNPARQDWFERWMRSGWDGKSQVLRYEVELRRSVLHDLKVDTFADFQQKFSGIWNWSLDRCVPVLNDVPVPEWSAFRRPDTETLELRRRVVCPKEDTKKYREIAREFARIGWWYRIDSVQKWRNFLRRAESMNWVGSVADLIKFQREGGGCK